MLTFDENHRYWDEGVNIPGFSEIKTALGIGINPFYTDDGRDEGTALHAWIIFLASGNEPNTEPDPRIAGRVAGFRKFLADSGFKFEGGEKPMRSRALGYCCTPDIYGQMGGARSLIEAKRGAEEGWHRLQTQAQKIALAENGIICRDRYALYLRDGDYRLKKHEDKTDEAKWRALVNGYHARSHFV